jgi:hypothetical protein
MILTNNKIYNYANQLLGAFSDSTQRLPARLNFIIHKNKNTLVDLAQDIERARIEIAQHYGTLDAQSGQYIVSPEHLAAAGQELEDLFNIEQEVNIATISADSLSDELTLTTGQMEAILFMID